MARKIVNFEKKFEKKFLFVNPSNCFGLLVIKIKRGNNKYNENRKFSIKNPSIAEEIIAVTATIMR